MTVEGLGSGFHLEQAAAGVDVVVTGDWSKQARNAVESGRADGLVLNYAKGFRERSLEFLRDLPLRRLRILARTLADLEPVYSLDQTLEELHADTAPTVIDLARLPKVRKLSADWAQIKGSIYSKPMLDQLYVEGYSEADLTPFAGNGALKRIVMKERPQLYTLDGLEALPNLETLGIYLAKNLRDITSLGASSLTKLRDLQFEACRAVTDLSPVVSCPGLQVFNFSDCGDIETIAPLAGLEGLTRLFLYGTTRVLDGDLGPIARLPRLRILRMRDRRTYTPSVAAIQETLPQG